MQDVVPSTDAKAATKRPWWRLHASTLVLALPAVAVLAALIVPRSIDGDRLVMGWPYAYMVAPTTSAIPGGVAPNVPPAEAANEVESTAAPVSDYTPAGQPYVAPATPNGESGSIDEFTVEIVCSFLDDSLVTTTDENPPWMDWDSWRPTGEMRLAWRGLAADLALGLSVLAAWTSLVKWRRRRRHRVWQLTLGEILVLTLLVALATAWLVHVKHRRDAEIRALAALGDRVFDYYTTCTAPAGLLRLVPTAWCRWFDRTLFLTLGNTEEAPTPAPNATLSQFHDLQHLNIMGPAVEGPDLARCATQCQLTWLNVSDLPIAHDDLADIGHCKALSLLKLEGVRMAASTAEVLLDQRHLTEVALFDCVAYDMATAERFRARHPDLRIHFSPTSLTWSRPESPKRP